MQKTKLSDYFLPLTDINWPEALRGFEAILPKSYNIWLVNYLGDVFITDEEEKVFCLRLDVGELEDLEGTRDKVAIKFEDIEFANYCFYMSLVDEKMEEGTTLADNECYAFQKFPSRDGEYEAENLAPMDFYQYIKLSAKVHKDSLLDDEE